MTWIRHILFDDFNVRSERVNKLQCSKFCDKLGLICSYFNSCVTYFFLHRQVRHIDKSHVHKKRILLWIIRELTILFLYQITIRTERYYMIIKNVQPRIMCITNSRIDSTTRTTDQPFLHICSNNRMRCG